MYRPVGLQFLEKATKGQKEVVQALLEYGAAIDEKDKDGKSNSLSNLETRR